MAAIISVIPALNTCSMPASDGETNNAHPDTTLLNTFFIRKKPYRVFLNGGKLVWERLKSNKDRITILVENILAVKYNATNSPVNESEQQQQQQTQQRNTYTVNDADKPSNIKQFTIFYAKRMENSSNPNKWRHFSQTFQNNESHICDLWIQTIQRQIDEQTGRPKRLLLFVNPYGGKKRALKIYDGTVKPIFQLAGIDASVVISQRSNQVRDFIMTQSLDHFDGIVCIGGDGTFSELFNGIIFRTFQDIGLNDLSNLDEMPKIIEKPLGIIPAGSTDTVAYCLNGTCDVRTIVLNIVLGQVNGLDLSSVSNQNGLLKFYASVMSYGFLGDVAVESEKFRWMGPKRYDYSGFKKLIRNRGYEGEISIAVDPSAGDPETGPGCLEGCTVCSTTNKLNKIQMDQPAVIKNSTENIGNSKCYNNNEQILNESNSHLTDNQGVKSIHIDICVRNTKNTTENTNDDGHYIKTINGKFFMVNGANISCACPRSPNGFSKYCHLCDGYIDLILVRHTSFINNLRFLLTMSSRNCRITDLNHVEIYRTKKFSFKPSGLQTGASAYNLHSSRVPIDNSTESNRSSVWNCDGEVIHDADVSVRSHRHIINVYRRELFNDAQKQTVDGNSEAPCCC